MDDRRSHRLSDDDYDPLSSEWWYSGHANTPDSIEVEVAEVEPVGSLWLPDGEYLIYPERSAFGFNRWLEE
jgi:hypothetical protein